MSDDLDADVAEAEAELDRVAAEQAASYPCSDDSCGKSGKESMCGLHCGFYGRYLAASNAMVAARRARKGARL